MPLAAPKITVSQLKTKYKFTAAEFVWPDGTSAQLTARLSGCVTQASRRVQQLIGVTTYASTDALTAALVLEGEAAFGGHFALRERLQILSGRPEEAPPDEYVDRQFIESEIDRLEEDAMEALSAYITSDLDKPGTGFAFGAIGVDETQTDRGDAAYDAIDYDALPS